MRLPINNYRNNLFSTFYDNSTEITPTFVVSEKVSTPITGVNYYKLSNGESLGIPVLPSAFMLEEYLNTLPNDAEKKNAYEKWRSLQGDGKGFELFQYVQEHKSDKDRTTALAGYSNILETTSSVTSASSGTTMTLNYDNISNIINKINASVEEVEANLRTVESNLISKINNSWASEAASQYTSKVVDSINRTKYIIETLKLLSQTYTKALNISKNTQQDVSSTVSNI